MNAPLLLKGKTVAEVPVSRERIGISYSGGGPLVVIELGVARAFVQRGIIPSVITGVSAGALAAAAHALDPQTGRGIDMGLEILADMSNHRFGLTLEQVLERLLTEGLNLRSFGDNAPLRVAIENKLESYFGLRNTRLDHFQPPVPDLMIAATDRRYGKSVWFPGDALLSDALLASTAIPGVFPWQEMSIGGVSRVLVDGGVVNNQPLSNLALSGCGTIYACAVGWSPDALSAPTNAFDNSWPCVGLMMHQCMRLEAEYVRSKMGDRGDLHEVRPQLTVPHGFDFTRAEIDELAGKACAYTLDWLDRGAPDEET